MQLDLPVLEAGATYEVTPPPGEEAVLVLLAGDVEWDGDPRVRGPTCSTPARQRCTCPQAAASTSSRMRPTELALAATRDAGLSAVESSPSFIAPADVVVHERGAPGWQRQVHDIAADNVHARGADRR